MLIFLLHFNWVLSYKYHFLELKIITFYFLALSTYFSDSRISALQYSANIIDTKSNLSFNDQKGFPYLSPSLCFIISKNEIADIFVELFKSGNQTVMINSDTVGLESCDSVVVYYGLNTNVGWPMGHFIQQRCGGEVAILTPPDTLEFQLSCWSRSRSMQQTPDFGGINLHAGTTDDAPFAIIKGMNNSDEFDGTAMRVVKELSRKLNFSLQFIINDSESVLDDNGTWIGGIGKDMQDGVIDFAVMNVWQVHPVNEVCDFSPSMSRINAVFMVRRPEQEDFRWQAFVTIFQPEVWLGTAFSFVVIVICYWIGMNWAAHPCKESWTRSFLMVLGYFLMTSHHSKVNRGNTLYTLASWSVFSLLIATSLSTGIVTRLAISLYEPRIDTVQQLVENGYYWTVQYYQNYIDNDNMKSAFFNFQDKWQRLFEKKYKYMELEEAEKIAGIDKKITFLVEAFGTDFVMIDTIGLEAHKALRKFRVSRQSISSVHVGFAIKKRSPFLEPLVVQILKFFEAGLLEYWTAEVLRLWPIYDTKHLFKEEDVVTFSEPHPLRLQKVQPIFFLLLFGLAAALVVFVVEFTTGQKN